MNYSRFTNLFPSTAFARRYIAHDFEKTEYRELKASIHTMFTIPLQFLVHDMWVGEREFTTIPIVKNDRMRWPIVELAPDFPGLTAEPDEQDLVMERDLVAELREMTIVTVRWRSYGMLRQDGDMVVFIPRVKRKPRHEVILFTPRSWDKLQSSKRW